jgi:hypothetical protein
VCLAIYSLHLQDCREAKEHYYNALGFNLTLKQTITSNVVAAVIVVCLVSANLKSGISPLLYLTHNINGKQSCVDQARCLLYAAPASTARHTGRYMERCKLATATLQRLELR